MGKGRNVERFIRETLNPYLRGWLRYFALGASKRSLQSHDHWIRRRMRCLICRQWKRPLTRVKPLLALGCSPDHAMVGCTRRGPWYCSGLPFLTKALGPAYFQQLDLLNRLDNMGTS